MKVINPHLSSLKHPHLDEILAHLLYDALLWLRVCLKMSERRGDESKRKNRAVGERWNKYPSVFPSTEINKAFTCQPAREGHSVYAEEKRDAHTQMANLEMGAAGEWGRLKRDRSQKMCVCVCVCVCACVRACAYYWMFVGQNDHMKATLVILILHITRKCIICHLLTRREAADEVG